MKHISYYDVGPVLSFFIQSSSLEKVLRRISVCSVILNAKWDVWSEWERAVEGPPAQSLETGAVNAGSAICCPCRLG